MSQFTYITYRVSYRLPELHLGGLLRAVLFSNLLTPVRTDTWLLI